MVGHPWLKAPVSYETSMITKELEWKRFDVLTWYIDFRAEVEKYQERLIGAFGTGNEFQVVRAQPETRLEGPDVPPC